MAQTAAAILSEAQDALLDILAGRVKSASILGKSYTTHNIDDLEDLIRRYEARAAVEAGRSRIGDTTFRSASG